MLGRQYERADLFRGHDPFKISGIGHFDDHFFGGKLYLTDWEFDHKRRFPYEIEFIEAGVSYSWHIWWHTRLIARTNGIIPPDDPIEFREISTDSRPCVPLVNSWIEVCTSTHLACAVTSMPTRLLNVSKEDPFLQLSEGLPNTRYVAISHCWSVEPLITTTTWSLELRLQSVPMSSLSRSFQDAVTITRKLGLNHLWIDSLCIIQDSKDDWATDHQRCSSTIKTGQYAAKHLLISWKIKVGPESGKD
jgi:Heterokaryon incompatibility protein (HET)